MTREVVLDTETTGLDPAQGDRVIEIGCIELINHIPSGKTFHELIHPERDIPEEAAAIHGIRLEQLAGKPVFAGIIEAFVDFIGDDKLIIHNAPFDVKFLNAELKRQERPPIEMSRVLDTVQIARRKFPGSPASLDALCKRFQIDLSGRTKHGALLDSELLARVYLELIGGHQAPLDLATSADRERRARGKLKIVTKRPTPLPPRLTPEEVGAHRAFIATLKDAMWLKTDRAAGMAVAAMPMLVPMEFPLSEADPGDEVETIGESE